LIEHYYIGIDDTDNLETKGTGFRAREIAKRIINQLKGIVHHISRHQLLFDPRIPFTSHNSSLCLNLTTDSIEDVKSICKEYLLEFSAPGSDAGLCIANKKNISHQVIEWGQKAKTEILTQKMAYEIAEENSIYLVGLTGTKDGIIGALAGVGLRAGGNDGRVNWLVGREVREMYGIFSAAEIKSTLQIDEIVQIDGAEIPDESFIFSGDWIRPIIKNHKLTLLVEPDNYEKCNYRVLSKDIIKSLSN
jgi:hypothetical protein